MYDEIKTYQMGLHLKNAVSSKSFYQWAVVVEKLVGPKIRRPFPSAPYNRPYNVTFSLYRGDRGNHTILQWDFGDGNPPVVTEREGETRCTLSFSVSEFTHITFVKIMLTL